MLKIEMFVRCRIFYVVVEFVVYIFINSDSEIVKGINYVVVMINLGCFLVMKLVYLKG